MVGGKWQNQKDETNVRKNYHNDICNHESILFHKIQRGTREFIRKRQFQKLWKEKSEHQVGRRTLNHLAYKTSA